MNSVDQIHLKVIAPDRILVDSMVDSVYLPGTEGEMGIMPEHMNLLTAMNMGEVLYAIDGEDTYIVIDGGFVQVKNNEVILLVENASFDREIDLEEASRRRKDVEANLKDAKTGSQEFMAMEMQLHRAMLDISSAKRARF